MADSASSDHTGTEVALGLGSNRPHGLHGAPRLILQAAIAQMQAQGLVVTQVSRIIETPPLGPSNRRYANAAVRGYWTGSAPELLQMLKALEREFGRKRGRRWGARVLDCDILVFGRMKIAEKHLQVPHPHMAVRDFVLRPLAEIWPDWRHPGNGLTVRQMLFRVQRPKKVD